MISWITKGFEEFRKGTFGNGGQNLYVSRQGVLQRIFQFDLNQDGFFDLVFANCQNHHESAESYLYDKDGNRTKLPGQGALSGMIADLNGNGYQDVFVTGHYDMAAPFASTDIYFGSPEGYSENNRIRIPTPWAVDCCCGDFSRRGKPAAAFAMPFYHTVRIFTQTKFGMEWGGYRDLPITANLICSADLDGDGFDELIVRLDDKNSETIIYWGGEDGIQTERKSVLPPLPESEYLLPEVEATRQSAMEKTFSAPRLLQKVIWQGRECFTLSSGKAIYFYSATKERELECLLKLDVPSAMAVAVGDLNEDGLPDIAIASRFCKGKKPGEQCSFIVWNSPDGLDKSPRTEIPTNQACHVALCQKHIIFCQGAAGRSFTNHALLFTAPDFEHPTLLESEDARRVFLFQNKNEDFRALIINHYARSCVGFDRSYIYSGGPDGFSADRCTEVPSWCAVDALCADLDDDGQPELLIANNSENSLNLDPGHLLHHFKKGTLEIDRSRNLKTDIGWGVTAGDFNHDGYLEIITPCNHWNDLRIFYGKDDFNSYETIPIGAQNSLHWICAADLNRNGWLDLVVPASRGVSMILWGGPKGFSIERSQELSVLLGVNATCADLSKNGYPDLIIGGHTELPKQGELIPHHPHSSFVYIYWNGPDGISEFRKCMLRGDAADSFAVGDFNNDGWLDVFAGSYHGGKDRDIHSFLYWNREGHFHDLDRQMLFTHSASGAIAADFNEDGFLDLAIANHKVNGDHKGWSAVWWNGPSGFNEERTTHLPTNGPHGMSSVPIGNILTRGPEEFYVSEPHLISCPCKVVSANVKAEIPSKTWVKIKLRHAADKAGLDAAPWEEPENLMCQRGEWLQYQLTLGAINSLRTPRISEVAIEMRETGNNSKGMD